MHFKLDENIPTALCSTLAGKGFTASTVYSQGLSGVKDRELARHCRQKEYVLVTLDADFSNVTLYPPKDYQGFIILRPKSQGIRAVSQFFEKFLTRFDIRTARHKTIIVEEQYIRIRE